VENAQDGAHGGVAELALQVGAANEPVALQKPEEVAEVLALLALREEPNEGGRLEAVAMPAGPAHLEFAVDSEPIAAVLALQAVRNVR